MSYGVSIILKEIDRVIKTPNSIDIKTGYHSGLEIAIWDHRYILYSNPFRNQASSTDHDKAKIYHNRNTITYDNETCHIPNDIIYSESCVPESFTRGNCEETRVFLGILGTIFRCQSLPGYLPKVTQRGNPCQKGPGPMLCNNFKFRHTGFV